MKFFVNQQCMFVSSEDKGNVALYTLLTLPNLDKIVAIGNKVDGKLKERSTVEATLELTTKLERFDLKNEDKARFVETVRVFIRDVKEV